MTPAPSNIPVPHPQDKRFVDLTGRRFQRLTAIRYVGKNTNCCHFWGCRCDCGKETVVMTSNLTRGTTRSCGCLQREVVTNRNTTHGLTHKNRVEYIAWVNIRNRCKDPKNRYYKDYGGRGIEICERWMHFELFFEDVGPRPSLDHSLDRIDNEKGYFKENVRWATPFEQAANRRSTRFIELNGERKPIAAWCRDLRINYRAAVRRFNAGYTPEEAFELVPSIRIRKSAKLRVDETDQEEHKSP